ncbi:MAG: translation elongation factor Ts [Candidatus Andersenbacteria bacterium]|nr:translation elongation factor Ts [bacterium]MDZ4225217.1 translation elongation factor Ts [Candidatus Andersenbacteria bacterium]
MSSLTQLKELRERTGCGVVDCKEALSAAQGDIDKAIAVLRERGQVKAAKKADRATREGVISTYVHNNNKIAAVVALLCETDFVARNTKFQELAHNIALHIAAADPSVISPDDVPEELLQAERAIAKKQAQQGNKPAAIQEKIINGKLQSFKAEKALLTQPFIKDPGKTVQDLINQAIQELGENITVGEIKRFSI